MSEEGMQENSETPKPLRTRRQGQRMSLDERKEAMSAFLDSFRREGNLSHACRVAGIHVDTPYDWKNRYKDFAEEFRVAEILADGVIDHEIYQRAIVGWQEPLVSAGQLVCYTTKKSDTMLTLLAKSRMAKYRDKQPDINITTQINQLADQAKNELLADLAASLTDEDQG